MGTAPWSCGLMRHVLDRESGRGTIDLPKHIKFSLWSRSVIREEAWFSSVVYLLVLLLALMLYLVKCYDNKMVKLPGYCSYSNIFMQLINKKKSLFKKIEEWCLDKIDLNDFKREQIYKERSNNLKKSVVGWQLNQKYHPFPQ